MAKPEPALLLAERYPHTKDFELRFTDLDVNQHLNNVAFLDLFQEGRVRFHERYAGWPDSRSYALVVASLAVEYLRDGRYPSPIVIHSGISHIGGSSHVVQQLMIQEHEPIAVARSVMVRTCNGAVLPNDAEFRQALDGWVMTP